MLPFWTALAAYFIIGEKPGLSRMIGLAVILIGAILVGLLQVLTAVGDDVWKGHLLFLGGSGVWAVHSVIFKQSGISPIHVLVIGIFWGTLFTTPLLFLTGNVSFQLVEIDDLLIMMVLQSFVMGILAMLLFTYAVRALGAAQTAAFGALIPILALLGGVVFLGEEVTALKLVGVALVAFGVFLASGMISKFRSMPSA
jgi:drug/metabolite transporter (DMT)-like permease